MKTQTLRRGTSILAVLTLVMATLAVPAFAAGPSATASLAVDDRLVTAGTTNQFQVTINNTEPAPNPLGQGGGDAIDLVVITVSTAFADLGVSSVEVPDGWGPPEEIRSNQIAFRATGDGLVPGESETFTVNSTIAVPASDKTGVFQVSVSGNGGTSQGPADPASDGALNSVLRILDISRLQVVEPIAEQVTVTDGQDNTIVAVDVNNHGSEDKTIVPTLTSSGDADFTVLTSPAAAPVPANGRTTFHFPVSFSRGSSSDDVAELTFDATVDSDDAKAEIPDSFRPTIEVQRAVSLTYLADTLTPRNVAAAKKDISLDLGKAGVPAADDLTLEATFVQDEATITPPAATAAAADEGDDVVSPTFADVPFDTAGLDDGEVTVSVTATGTDANGARIDIPDINVSDTIYLDLLAPVLTISEFSPPSSRVQGMDPAATEGEAFHLVGDVTDRGVGCAECTVTGTLRIGTGSASDVAVELDSNGGFDQDVVVTDAPTDTQDSTAVLTLTAVDSTDEAGDEEHVDSGTRTGIVDTLAPDMKATAPLTGGLAQIIGEEEDRSRIDVLFPEGIAATYETSALNWSVQVGEGSDNPVTDATIRTATADTSGAVGGVTYAEGQTVWFVQLALQNELGGNDEGVVTYEPDSRLGTGVGETSGATRIHDRVELSLPFGAKELIDNIAPDLPVIGTVAGKLAQTDDDGQERFFTNSETMDVTVTQLEPGSTVELFLREKDGTEQTLGQAEVVSGDSHTFQAVMIGGLDREFEYFAVASDSGLKSSVGEPGVTVLDRVAPKVASATFDGAETLRVVTDEGLVGANRSFDWYATATDENGDQVVIFVNSVAMASDTESYDLRERDLALDTSTYDPGEGGNAALDELFYDYQGPEDGQFRDRAGNLFERLEPIAINSNDGSGSNSDGASTTETQSNESLPGRITGAGLGS